MKIINYFGISGQIFSLRNSLKDTTYLRKLDTVDLVLFSQIRISDLIATRKKAALILSLPCLE